MKKRKAEGFLTSSRCSAAGANLHVQTLSHEEAPVGIVRHPARLNANSEPWKASLQAVLATAAVTRWPFSSALFSSPHLQNFTASILYLLLV